MNRLSIRSADISYPSIWRIRSSSSPWPKPVTAWQSRARQQAVLSDFCHGLLLAPSLCLSCLVLVLQSRQVLEQIDQLLLGHVVYQVLRHHRELAATASLDVGRL